VPTHKRITKRQMKEDPLVTYTYQFTRFLKDHLNAILGGALFVIVVIGSVLWMGKSRNEALESAEQQFREGFNRYNSGQYSVAVDYLQRVAEDHGGGSVGARAQYFLGNCYLMTGQYEQAIDAFDRYLKDPDRFPIYERPALDGKAVALEDLGRDEEAAGLYRQLAEGADLPQARKEYLWSAAECLVRAGQKESALEVYAQLEELADPLDMARLEAERLALE
jgi:TolA-binding protein